MTEDFRPPPGIGWQPAPMNAPPAQPLGYGVQPGQSGIVRANLVIISGVSGGLFLYSGTPAPGNPPVMWAVPPGVTQDPYGNTVAAVFGVGITGGPGLLIDQFGNLTTTGADGSFIELSPSSNLPFSLTSAIAGIMQGAMELSSADLNQTQFGVVADIVLGTGATAKMGTLIFSPYGTTGTGMLLQAQNDGATDTASIVFGTVATQGGTVTFTPTYAILPGVLIGYLGTGRVTVVTRTSGSGTISIPAGVSVGKGECWGTSGFAGVGAGGGGGGGAGGGEYAQEPALALTPGGTAAYVIPAHGAGPTTLTGSAVTVTANQGGDGTGGNIFNPGTHGTGGNGSTNTIHFNGGNGGDGGAAGGGGGGASGGSGGAGGAGKHGSPGASGQPGQAQSGGANGGQGGTSGHAGSSGQAPGGGPGADGNSNTSPVPGSLGQVRLTYTSGAPAVMWSMNGTGAAVTDQFGTSIPAGNFVNLPDTNAYRTERFAVIASGSTLINSLTDINIAGLAMPVGIGTYLVRGIVLVTNGAVAATQAVGINGPAASSVNVSVSWYSGTANTFKGYGQMTSLGTRVATTSNMGIGENCQAFYEGLITFTAAGTVQITGSCVTAAADTFTALARSHMELRPV